MPLRALAACASGLALLAARGGFATPDSQPLDPQPLHDGSPAQRQGRFVGVAHVRPLRTWSGCTAPPTIAEHAFLEWAGNFLPLADAGPEHRLWTLDDLETRGIAPGEKIAVTGRLEPVYRSGTVGLMSYPGFAVERLERAQPDDVLAPAPPPRPVVAAPSSPDAFARPDDATAPEAQLYREIHDGDRALGVGEEQLAPMLEKLQEVWEKVPEPRRRELMLTLLRQLRASLNVRKGLSSAP